MRLCERRLCPKCGTTMRIREGTDRTERDRVWFVMRCYRCGHSEMEWCSVTDWRKSMR